MKTTLSRLPLTLLLALTWGLVLEMPMAWAEEKRTNIIINDVKFREDYLQGSTPPIVSVTMTVEYFVKKPYGQSSTSIIIYDSFPLESYFEDQEKSRAQLEKDAVKLIESMADIYRTRTLKKP